MTNEDFPPDWAIQAALDRAGCMSTVGDVKRSPGKIKVYVIALELARMIAKHEEKPDPLAADREFVASMWRHVYGERGDPDRFTRGSLDQQTKAFMAYLRANIDKITGNA